MQGVWTQSYDWHQQPAATLAAAKAQILAGGVVLAPTETFYGLLARADVAGAVAKVLALKARPSDKPLPLVVADGDHAAKLARISPLMAQLMAAFWPGPLTLVLPSSGPWPAGTAASALAEVGEAEPYAVALRASGHPFVRALCQATGLPLTATSANLAGDPAVCALAEVKLCSSAGVGEVLAVEGGQTPGGLASTLATEHAGGLRILRVGAVATRALAAYGTVT